MPAEGVSSQDEEQPSPSLDAERGPVPRGGVSSQVDLSLAEWLHVPDGGVPSQVETPFLESSLPVDAAGRRPASPVGSLDADADADADAEVWSERLWLRPDREALLRSRARRRRRAAEVGLEPITVLADPVRATIVALLCSGSTTAGDIASAVHDRHGVGWSSVSRHLSVLRASGFALDWHDPPRRFWYLTDDWLHHLHDALAEWEERWQAGAGDRGLGHVPYLVGRGLLPAVGEGPGQGRRRARGRRGRDRSAYGDGRSGNGDDDGGHGLDRAEPGRSHRRPRRRAGRHRRPHSAGPT